MTSFAQGPAVLFELLESARHELIIQVSFAGIMPRQTVDVVLLQTGAEEAVLGTVRGRLEGKINQRLGLVPAEPPRAYVGEPFVTFRFPSPRGHSDFRFPLSRARFDRDEGQTWQVKARIEALDAESPTVFLSRVRRQPELREEAGANAQHVGYSWTNDDAAKPVDAAPVAGGATYDWHAGHSVQFYADASVDATGTAGAMHDIVAAIRDARHFVFVVDWSFQPLFCPSRSAPLHRRNSIGALLLEHAAANPELLIAIHTWNHTRGEDHVMPIAADQANDLAVATFERLARERGQRERPPNLLWRATSRTGTGWSHHQKFVVLDAPGDGGRRELKVFWGGLDLTKGRFDWHAHVVDPDVPEARRFRTTFETADGEESSDDWYNAEFELLAVADTHNRMRLPRQPWHDIHGRLTGPAAWDFVREFVGRWSVTPSRLNEGDNDDQHVERVWSLFRKLYQERTTFVQQYEGKLRGQWSAQVYRSLTLEHWGPPDRQPADDLDTRLFALLRTDRAQTTEQSIRLAYQHNIDRAERFIYIENQYFLGSGRHFGEPALDNDIPERLVRRIRQRAKHGFHVYIVMPMFPEGDPVSGGIRQVRLYEWLTMQYMVRELHRDFGKKWRDYLSFYFLANWSVKTHSKRAGRVQRVGDHQRYMVYVHSKLMLIDDRYALFGSCNLNDRGLAGGGDSEIACGVWPSHGEDAAAVSVEQFRKTLWLEHFGKLPVGADRPESPACVTAVQAHADLNYLNFRTMSAPPQGHICRLPLVWRRGALAFKDAPQGVILPDEWGSLPDAPNADAEWQWSSLGSTMVRILGVSE